MGHRGLEYNLVMLATIFAITEAGPGRVSLDQALGREGCGSAWALAQLAAGAAGSELIERLAKPGSTGEDATEVGEPSADGAQAPAHSPA